MFSLADVFGPFAIVSIVLILVDVSVREQRQYGRAFTLERFSSIRAPGLLLLIPRSQQLVRVDSRKVVSRAPRPDLVSSNKIACGIRSADTAVSAT
jgi:regulator of protease activity HflC (stomatin/prohibitin superfamily)